MPHMDLAPHAVAGLPLMLASRERGCPGTLKADGLRDGASRRAVRAAGKDLPITVGDRA